MYLVLALATLVDLDVPQQSHDAHYYLQLGRAALSVDSIFEGQSIIALQALVRAFAVLSSFFVCGPDCDVLVDDGTFHVLVRYRRSPMGCYGNCGQTGSQRAHGIYSKLRQTCLPKLSVYSSAVSVSFRFLFTDH